MTYNFNAPLDCMGRHIRQAVHWLHEGPFEYLDGAFVSSDRKRVIQKCTMKALRRRSLVEGAHRVELNMAGIDIAARLSRLPNRGLDKALK